MRLAPFDARRGAYVGTLSGKWRARVTIQGKTWSPGVFATETDAGMAAKLARDDTKYAANAVFLCLKAAAERDRKTAANAASAASSAPERDREAAVAAANAALRAEQQARASREAAVEAAREAVEFEYILRSFDKYIPAKEKVRDDAAKFLRDAAAAALEDPEFEIAKRISHDAGLVVWTGARLRRQPKPRRPPSNGISVSPHRRPKSNDNDARPRNLSPEANTTPSGPPT
mmetsp:Transcript_9822/g.29369  ORF Transcript_9822/g.29369 Transcript_9822/m.29369 type:complete len:231 (+) Transcript_9822:590-1282(+)